MYNKQTSNENLYAQFYSSTDLPSMVKRGEQQTELDKAIISFKNKDFKTTVTYINSFLLNNEETSPSVYIYLGVAYTELKEYDKAIIEFDKLINSNAIDVPKALWFKSLSYVKANNIEKAKETLSLLIKDSEAYKHQEVEKLIDELK